METAMFEDIVQRQYGQPLVFRNLITSWSSCKWTPSSLAQILPNKILQCKVSPIDIEGVQWETESLHVSVTLQQYVDWLSGAADHEQNVLHNFDPHKYSCYIDYKYMKDMFQDTPALLKDVDWGVFGLDGRGGEDSTIWIGSTGAYTPCHYDSYGFNLVAQLYGSKRWYLVSPEKMEVMYPTRIPYEESSVFSEVNIRCPDLKKHPRFKDMDVYIVDLQPGEALYVPQHWWHFVECLQPAISVNTWIPLHEDTVSHFHEAVARYLLSAMLTAQPDQLNKEDVINTNEEVQPPSVNMEYLNNAARNYQLSLKRRRNTTDSVQTRRGQKDTQYFPEEKKQFSKGKVENFDLNYFEKFCHTFHSMPVNCKIVHQPARKRTLRNKETETINCCKVGKYDGQLSNKDFEDDSQSSFDSYPSPCDPSHKFSNHQSETVSHVKYDKLEINCCQKYSFLEYIKFLQKHYDYSESDFDHGYLSHTNSNNDEDKVKGSVSDTDNCDKETDDKNCESRIEGKRALSAYEIHRHLEPSCSQSTEIQSVLDKCDQTIYDCDVRHEDTSVDRDSITHLDVLNSILHPEVIATVAKVLNRKLLPS